MLIAAGCSTRKNTSGTRFYHAMTTRYNVYHNGQEAYKAGILAQQQGNKDNHIELLPLYPIGNSTTTSIGSGDFDRAIEKAQKAIRRHSIKRRPTRNPNRAYTESYKQWLKRREFNPFLHNAWMLLGKAQYQKGDFEEAASTFSYITRLYEGQTNVTSEALIWQARCYAALGWHYDAEDALNRVNNDSLPTRLTDAFISAQGNRLLVSGQHKEAIPYIEHAARKERNRQQRARIYYLLGQLYQLHNRLADAHEAFAHVVRLSPPYELAMNARIRQSEVLPSQQGEKGIKRLLRMGQEERNKEYLDQIFYAIGNIYLDRKDTVQALNAYLQGVEKGTRNGVEKGVLLTTLGNLYWTLGEFPKASKAYTQAIGLLDKTHKSYKEVTRRSEILDNLVPHLETIQLQDSLQYLASLSEEERMKVIEKIIASVIAEEEKAEEENKKEALRALKEQTQVDTSLGKPTQAPATPTLPSPPPSSGKQAWYFYNQLLVEQGKVAFQKQWGKRKLEDNWRRKNKTVVSLEEFAEIDYSDNDSITQQADTIPPQEETETLPDNMLVNDTLANDHHHPAYYLKQIPLTEDALATSNDLLTEALFNAGKVYREMMQDYPRAEQCMQRLLNEFPNYEKLDEALYQLFLLEIAKSYNHLGKGIEQSLHNAESYKQQLIERYPKSKYTAIVSDPEYIENARKGRVREYSLYTQAYNNYQAANYEAVYKAAEISKKRYSTGKHRAKFLFLEAASKLQEGKQKAFLDGLKTLVQQYPTEEITDIAAHILKGVQEGRLLADESRSFGSIWKQRATVTAKIGNLMNDTTDTDILPPGAFATERETPFLFILAFEEGKIDEKLLLYEVAKYNFATFLVKNFDLSFAHERGIGMLHIRSFANYDEAHQYFRRLFANEQMAQRLSGLRVLIISESNYEQLIKQYSFDDYDTFFREHFLPIPETELEGYTLDEPLLTLPKEEENSEEILQALPETEEEEDAVIFE